MGRAGDPAPGVWAAAEAAGEFGEPAEEQELLDPAAAPGYQRRHSKGKPCTGVGGASARPYCCSVARSCLTLCDPMDCTTPGFPVLHHLLELASALVH